MPLDAEPVTVAIMAKAPVAGLAKTRLIPDLGPHGAAALQEKFVIRTVETAIASRVGPVTVWTTPDEQHPLFQALVARLPIALAPQPEGDIGARMLAAFVAARGPTLVIGVDCPPLTPSHLRQAAAVLREKDAVLIPVEDGGYVLIGLRKAHAAPFSKMPWSTAAVARETRKRFAALGLTSQELPPLWDVDEPADLARMRADGFGDFLP